MKIDLNSFKKYWLILALIVPYLGLASYAEGLRPVFYFQLQNVACVQIVAGYIQAKNNNNQALINYWVGLSRQYGCQLPPV